MDLRALARSSALYTIGNFARRIVGFLMIPIYTRFLTTADYGLIELIDLSINVATITLGLQAMGSSLIRIYHDSKDPDWQARVVSTAIMAVGGVSLVLSTLGIALSGPIATLLFGDTQHQALLAVAFATVVMGSARGIGLTYLRIRDQALHFVLVNLATLVVNLGLNIYLIVFLGMGVWGFVLGNLVSAAMGTLYLGWIMIRRTGLRWDGEAARRMWSFGSPLVFAGLAMFGIHFLDRFVLNAYSSLSSVGLYALAYKFGFLMTYFVGGPFHQAWNARLYAYTDEGGWKEKFGQVFLILVFILTFVWTGLSSLIDEILVVIAEKSFHSAAVFVPWIAMGYSARTLGDYFRTLLYINKRSGLATKLVIVCAVLNGFFDFALIPFFGGWGATWATLLTWVAYMLVMGRYAQREHRLPLPYRESLLVVAIGLGLYFASGLFDAHGMLVRLGWSLLTALLFLPLAWFLGGFPESQKETLRRWARARWARLRSDSA